MDNSKPNHSLECRCQAGVVNHSSGHNIGDNIKWVWDSVDKEFTTKGYQCTEDRHVDYVNCMQWDESTNQCELCRRGYFLNHDNKCFKREDLPRNSNSTPFMPFGCYTAKTNEDYSETTCQLCLETYSPDNSDPPQCVLDGKEINEVKIPFCEFQYVLPSTLQDNVLMNRKCYQCVSTHVLKKMHGNMSDECLKTDNKNLPRDDFGGCRYISSYLDNGEKNECIECKEGYAQMMPDNSSCRLVKRLDLTEGVRRELAMRRNSVTMTGDQGTDFSQELHGVTGGTPSFPVNQ